MLGAVIILGSLALLFGLLLGYAAVRFRVEGNPVADQVDNVLPQAQCGQCGYPGCRAYAEAVVVGEADINLCPPGGEGVMLELAKLLDRDPKPLEVGELEVKPPSVAVIDEQRCIGCTLCIQACPVDAIVGAPKQMHTVIAAECTGCELCLPPCPVDCVIMVPLPQGPSTWKWPYPSLKREEPVDFV
jgi:Na+-translocating ferredoxin:NAD+ oxidoreductase subunit B